MNEAGFGEFCVGQDSQSQAALKSAMSGDEKTAIPAAVDSPSPLVQQIDQGTSIPGKVDSPGITRG